MNPKIQKTIAEIERTKLKIAELQTRLQELEGQRVDLENTDVIAAFRSTRFTPEEFAAFLQAYKAGSPAPASAAAPSSSTALASSYQIQRKEIFSDEND